MSEENIEIVRRCYGLGADRDFSTLSELAHPDVVVDLSRNVFNPTVDRGLDGFRHFVEQVDEMWEDFQIEPVEFIDAGDNVFVASQMSGRGRGSGVEVEMRAFAVWTLREGKVSRFRAVTGIAPKPSKPPGCGSSRPLLWTRSGALHGQRRSAERFCVGALAGNVEDRPLPPGG
jgi:ketosteroid isomerase-like protein